MNIFDFIEKYKIEGKRTNIRPWGSYQLAFQFGSLNIGTPATYGWGIDEKIALAIFLTEVRQMGYISEVEKWMPADAYKDYLEIELSNADDLFPITPIKEDAVVNGTTKLLHRENPSGSGAAIYQEVAL